MGQRERGCSQQKSEQRSQAEKAHAAIVSSVFSLEPILVRFRNQLPRDHAGFGIPSVITHLHNGHTASESDGSPLDFYETGHYKDHHYPNILAAPAGSYPRARQ